MQINKLREMRGKIGESGRVWLLMWKPNREKLQRVLRAALPGWVQEQRFHIDVTEVYLFTRPKKEKELP